MCKISEVGAFLASPTNINLLDWTATGLDRYKYSKMVGYSKMLEKLVLLSVVFLILKKTGEMQFEVFFF